jgi:hypothetical protein
MISRQWRGLARREYEAAYEQHRVRHYEVVDV